MALAPGARFGGYEILAAIGAGGMGDVYRARDTRLRREVAVKVLREKGAFDADRLARFEREAQVLASLNHPNIAAVYGFEEGAIILELVEGSTVADLLGSGPLPIREALTIARQVCDALEAAHEQGIIHRDLKPANIKVRPDGVAKVLDFGLAKAVEPLAVAPSVTDTPTVTSPAVITGVGVIAGTAAYMSPEQARGKPLDRRADIWSFGCVLYEMLTGRRAFGGDDVADTLSRVLQREPDYTALPPGTPPALRRLIARCLEKERNARLPQIAAAAFQIEEALAGLASGFSDAAPPARFDRRILMLAVTLAAGMVIGAATSAIYRARGSVPAPPVTRLLLSIAPADEVGGTAGRPTRPAFALSPDGLTLVFSATQKGARALYVRRFDRPTATPLAGTEGAINPFFSPDGQWVGYWVMGQIRKTPIAGGPSVLVTATPQIFGASWGDDDRIVFARSAGGLLEVPAGGGKAVEFTTPNRERGEVSHRLPHVLPGSDAILFTVTFNRFPRWDEAQVWVHSRAMGTSRRLIDGGADARFVSSGHLAYVREGTLLTVPFDRTRLEVSGGPAGVTDVMQAAYVPGQNGDTGVMQASVSASGALVYIAGSVHPSTECSVVRVDRQGREEVLPITPQEYRTLRLSPDGTRLALSTAGRDRTTWIYSFVRGTLSKLAASGRSSVPVWTPDGERITYAAGANGPDSLHAIRADGGGSAENLVSTGRNLVPAGWTADGRRLVYYVIPDLAAAAGDGPTIWVQDVGARTSAMFRSGGSADLSPDGQWIAYGSAESGRTQVWVEAFPGPGPRFQVSTEGGDSPIWRGDGGELIYIQRSAVTTTGIGAENVIVMAVDVTWRPTPTFGAPRKLFAGRYSVNGPARGLDMTRDGQWLLLLKERERAPDVVTTMNVVQNWTAELQRQP